MGFVQQVAEIILEEHGEEHRGKAGQRENVGAVEPAKALLAEVVVVAFEEVGGADNLPRPKPGWKPALGWSFKVVGDAEDDEGE